MKKYLLMGIIVSAYGISVPVFASDTATLTISGKVTAPTCSTEVVNAQLQQRCGNTIHVSNLQTPAATPMRGVTTQLYTVPGDSTRQIVVNHYD
ncbi:YehE family protein [Salmonella enterica subsp. enterica serovar Braenderup]|nr:YehE family protein [Salmonella enterica subsp. enterica serovar Braenderup]